jgi:hypothetical protein
VYTVTLKVTIYNVCRAFTRVLTFCYAHWQRCTCVMPSYKVHRSVRTRATTICTWTLYSDIRPMYILYCSYAPLHQPTSCYMLRFNRGHSLRWILRHLYSFLQQAWNTFTKYKSCFKLATVRVQLTRMTQRWQKRSHVKVSSRN